MPYLASLLFGFVRVAIGWLFYNALVLNVHVDERAHLDGEASQFPCPEKYPGEHGAVEAASVGVAQRGVVGGEKMQAVG